MAGASETTKDVGETPRQGRNGGEFPRARTVRDQVAGAGEELPGLREHQAVYAACGSLVGKVDHIEGVHIKLEHDGSGRERLIPVSWVAKVDDRHIDLNRDLREVQRLWEAP